MKLRRPTRKAVTMTCAAMLGCGVPQVAHAHGLWGHVHVTGWAVENLPPGELRDFFSNTEVRDAALFGAAYTDSGYSVGNVPLVSDQTKQEGRDYSEHAHWEPFIQDFVQWIRNNDPPPWDTLESQKRVAFLMGVASHGLQDELFDSLFLFQTVMHDGKDQEAADPGTDGFLGVDGLTHFVPPTYVPMDTVREIYASEGLSIPASTIDIGTTVIRAYLNDISNAAVLTGLALQYESQLPWTRQYYNDPAIPGSIRSEILPTAFYIQAIWDRLHGRFDPNQVVTQTFPTPPRRLNSHVAATPDSWVTLIFGEGVAIADAQGTLNEKASGAAVVIKQEGTRWGAEFPRLMRLEPAADLTPGAWYSAGLQSGARLIGGGTSNKPFRFDFQVACTPETAGECPDLGDIPVASQDGSGPPPGLYPDPPNEGEGDGGVVNPPGQGDGDGSGDGDGDGTPPGDGDSGDGDSDSGDGDLEPTADGGTETSIDPGTVHEVKARSGGGCALATGPKSQGWGLPVFGLALLLANRRRQRRRASGV